MVPPIGQQSSQHQSLEGRSSNSSYDVVKRYDNDELTVAVIHGLASLTSRTGTLVVIVGGLVRSQSFSYLFYSLCCSGMCFCSKYSTGVRWVSVETHV